jgi:hypothetical protein
VLGQHAKALPRLGIAALGLGVGHQHQAAAVGQVHRHRARRLGMGIASRGRTADQQVALRVGHVQRDAKPGQQLGKGLELRIGHDGSSLRRTDARHQSSRRNAGIVAFRKARSGRVARPNVSVSECRRSYAGDAGGNRFARQLT